MHLSPKEKLVRRESGGTMCGNPLRPQDKGQEFVPLYTGVLCAVPQEPFKGRVEPLHHTIRLGVVWGGSDLVYSSSLTKLHHDFRYEVGSIISQNFFRYSYAGSQFYQAIHYCLGCCFFECKGFRPVSRVVHGYQNVLLPSLSLLQGP